jgi:uncharacterized membrane protein
MLEDYQPKPRTLWFAALVFVVVVVADSWFRWWSFQYRTFDLAFYVQSFWLMLHGQWHVSLLDVPMMGNHAEPICFLLLPFFWIWQSPMFFVVVQALMLSTMPFTAYRIARRLEFERHGAMWLALATLLAPATGFIALHEFHPEALAAPLILLMLEARQAQRPGSFWVCFILAAMCKENVAFLLAWMCVVNWVFDRENGPRWQSNFNILPGLVALGWVALYAVWLAPAWNGGKVDYLEIYSHLGQGGGDILGKMFTEPSRVWHAFWNGATGGNLIWGLLVPFLLLPLLRPRWLIISAPIFAQHLLSIRSSEWSIQAHYAAPLVPLMWMGTMEAAANMFWRENVAKWIVAACAVGQITFGPLLSIYGTITKSGPALQQHELRAEMLTLIPPDASAMVGEPYLSHLAKRRELHALHFTLKGLKTLSRADYIPPQVDHVLVDANDGATFDPNSGYYHPNMKTVDGRVVPDSDLLLHRYLMNGTWRERSVNALTLFQRGSMPQPDAATSGRELDGFHKLVSLEPFTPKTPGCLGLVFTWALGKDRKAVPWAKLTLESVDHRKWTFDKGPVALGMEAGNFREEWIVSPELPPGKYRAQLTLQENPWKYFEFEPDGTKKPRYPGAEPIFPARAFDLNGEISL